MDRVRWIIFTIATLAANVCFANNAVDHDNPLIFPIPQQIKLTGDVFQITDQTVIELPAKPSQNDIFLAQFLTTELADHFGFAIKTVRLSGNPIEKNIILMGSISNELIKRYCKNNHIKITNTDLRAEGYISFVDKNVVVIIGDDDAGAFYGLQSLRQLIKKENNKLFVTGVEIHDWPYKPFRALRLYVPGKNNLQFFKRFLRDFMALYKYNKVILEMNAVMRFDRHPELNAGAIDLTKSMICARRDRPLGPHGVIQDSANFDAGDGGLLEKQDVAEIVQYARCNNIDVIPEIPSLTHSYYLLTRHRELAEIPDSEWPDTYCPSNPKIYELMFDVLDEYIDVMKPSMINIGHDEWRMPFGVCHLCKDKNYADLFVNDVNRIYNHLKSKHIKVAMWCDHLLESARGKGLSWGSSSIFPDAVLTKEQVQKIDPNAYFYNLPGAVPEEQVVKSIPKDILVLNWFWSKTQQIEGLWAGGENNELKLQEMGFQQIYGNLEANVQNWAQRTRQPSVIGGAPSSWSASTEFNFGKDQMINFLGCANLLWSTHWPERKDLVKIVCGRMSRIHSDLSGKQYPSCDSGPVVPLEITRYFNASTSEAFVGQKLENLQAGKIVAGKRIFNLAEPNTANGKLAAVVGTAVEDGNQLPKEVLGITLGKDVTSIIFLHACAVPAGKSLSENCPYNFLDTADLLGWYEIIYEDGFVETIPIRYGVNIFEWDGRSEGYCYAAEPVCYAVTIDKKPVTFYAFEWTNTKLGKKIEQINLKSSSGFKGTKEQTTKNNAVILLGISTVEKSQ